MNTVKVKCPCCYAECVTPIGEMDRRFARTAAVLALGEAELARVLLDLKEGEPEEYPTARRMRRALLAALRAVDAAVPR